MKKKITELQTGEENHSALESVSKKILAAAHSAMVEAYEDAGLSGLCAEGRWELAVEAVKNLDLKSLLNSFAKSEEGATINTMTRSIRFKPDPLDHALIDFNFDGSEFVPSAVALIRNESYTGCSLVIHTKQELKPGQKIKVSVGRIGVLPCKVVWSKEIEPSLVQIGVQFLD